MRKLLNFIAVAGMCLTAVPHLSAQRIVTPTGSADGFAAAYMGPQRTRVMHRLEPRRSSGFFDATRQLNGTFPTPRKAPQQAPGDINLLGYVSAGSGLSYGYMYNVPYRTGGNFTQASTSFIYNGWGGVEVNGIYYTAYQYQISPTAGYNYLYSYNTSNWFLAGTTQLQDFALFATALAKDPLTDQVYGCFMAAQEEKYEMGVADFANATRTTVCDISPDNPWTACAIDSDGVLYAIDARGDLYTVDKATGAQTLVGSTGVTTKYIAGACYDASRKRILRAVCNDTWSGLYEVNPATAECLLMTEFPNNEEVLGMFIGAPLAADAAPEAPADIVADFPEGNLSGKVSFTIPATTFDGNQADGEVKWEVYGFYQTLASGTSAHGQKVEADITAPYAGQATFTITLSNDAGPSPKGTVSCFIGKGTPAIPLPFLTCVDGLVTINWDPVTTAADAGYLNPDDVTYTVTRWPDNVVVASHIKENSFSEQLDEPDQLTRYHYTVVAEYGDKSSGFGTTVNFILGKQGVPYINDLSQYGSLDFCTVLDANGDNVTWTWNGMGATIVNYAANVPADDWLFTPGITLEKDHAYYAEFTFRSYPPTMIQFDQCDIEIMRGGTPSPEGMTTTIKELTPIDKLSSVPLTTVFRAEADGPCHLGVHALSPETNWVQITKIVLKDASMPDSIQNLSIDVEPYPSMTAKVKFDAPSLTVAGDELESLSRIDIVRGGVVVKTIENPVPGESIEFEDVIGTAAWASGNYMWVITPYNEIGEGLKVERIAYVGLDAPAMPETIEAVEDGNTGRVTLSWSPVTTDVHGRPLAAEYIHYRILNNGSYIDNDPVIENNSYTYQVCDPSTQDFAMMGVQLYNERSSSVAFTSAMPVGKPYGIYTESFENGVASHPTALFDSQFFGMWMPVADGYYEGYYSADGDGGFLAIGGDVAGCSSSICLGKFNLSGMENPRFSLMVMNVWDGNDEHFSTNSLDILADCGNGFESVGTISCDVHDACAPGTYAKLSVDLSQLVDKGDIRLALRGTLSNYTIIAVDKIKIAPVYDHNLSLVSISSPSHVQPGADARVHVTVENNGLEPADGYTVTLMRDGEPVATLPGESIAPDASAVIAFRDPVSVLSPAEITYSARVDYDVDMDKNDNLSGESVSIVDLPKYPAPEALAAEGADDGSVALSWTEPAPAMEADPVTESFEAGEPYAIDCYGDWTFVDRDGKNTYEMCTTPYTGSGSPQAFVAFKPVALDLSYNPGLAALTGERYLAAISPDDGSACDDWAISPALSGSAQTVTFYARSLFIEDGGESFRFLYSTGSLDPDDFIEVETVDVVPAQWTLYSCDIPEGAKYFAINCISSGQWMLMIDDVTYIPEGIGANLSLLGYNVYRNGVKVNNLPVEDVVYTDAPGETGSFSYVVTAIYDKGESVGSNQVSVDVTMSGIGSIEASSPVVTGGKGVITVTRAAGAEISVIAVDGRTIAVVSGKDSVVIPAAPGACIVKVGSHSVKTIVR